MGRVSAIPPPPESSDDASFTLWAEAVTTRLNAIPRLPIFKEGPITDSATVANTTDETTIFTETITPNELLVGQSIAAHLLGRYSTGNASDVFGIRFKMGGTLISTVTSVAGNVTDAPLRAEFTFTVRETGTSGKIFAYTDFIADNTHDDQPGTAEVTLDTTDSQDITATIAWDAVDSQNTVTIDQAFVTSEG